MNNKEILYSNLATMTYEQYEKFLEEEKNGYIKINKHPEDENIIILNYTDQTTYDRHWTDETLRARGLILDITYATKNDKVYILASPFGKFFNYNENAEYQEGIEDWKIESVMEKMDGSLGISYFFNDNIRFATRGSFVSEQAIKATEIWNEKYAQNLMIRIDVELPVTYLVEIIYPENRIVVDYGKSEELVLLGLVFNGNPNIKKRDAHFTTVENEAKILGMRSASLIHMTIDEMMEAKKTISPNDEGWVVKFTNGKRLKIKGDQYMSVHRIMHGLSKKAKYKAWSEDRLDDYIMQLPEEYRDELEKFKEDIEMHKDAQVMLVELYYRNALENSTNQAEFAQYIKFNFPKEYHNFIFSMRRDNVIPLKQIKYKIYKNYKDFEVSVNE